MASISDFPGIRNERSAGRSTRQSRWIRTPGAAGLVASFRWFPLKLSRNMLDNIYRVLDLDFWCVIHLSGADRSTGQPGAPENSLPRACPGNDPIPQFFAGSLISTFSGESSGKGWRSSGYESSRRIAWVRRLMLGLRSFIPRSPVVGSGREVSVHEFDLCRFSCWFDLRIRPSRRYRTRCCLAWHSLLVRQIGVPASLASENAQNSR